VTFITLLFIYINRNQNGHFGAVAAETEEMVDVTFVDPQINDNYKYDRQSAWATGTVLSVTDMIPSVYQMEMQETDHAFDVDVLASSYTITPIKGGFNIFIPKKGE